MTHEQLAALADEGAGAPLREVITLVESVSRRIENALTFIKATSEESLLEARAIGREHLPTNALGLLFHIAEHTQRHTGQIITTARIVRGM